MYRSCYASWVESVAGYLSPGDRVIADPGGRNPVSSVQVPDRLGVPVPSTCAQDRARSQCSAAMRSLLPRVPRSIGSCSAAAGPCPSSAPMATRQTLTLVGPKCWCSPLRSTADHPSTLTNRPHVVIDVHESPLLARDPLPVPRGATPGREPRQGGSDRVHGTPPSAEPPDSQVSGRSATLQPGTGVFQAGSVAGATARALRPDSLHFVTTQHHGNRANSSLYCA
jgi:hypothetical protein